MGCGSSKGVAPAPGPQPTAASPAKDGQGAQPAAGSDAAALHKQRLEQQHSHKQDEAETQHQQQQQGDMSLPGRIESTTAPLPPPNLLRELPKVVDLPPLRKSDPAKAAADAEFDYGKELQRGAALGSGGGAPPVSSAQGDVVGGLLSKQPDWLHGSNADPSTGKLPTLAPAQGGAAAAGKAASSLPPLVGRGMGAAAGGGSSLPPLAAGGAKALVPAGSQHKPQEAEADAEGSDMHGAGGPAHAEGGHAGKQAPSDKHADSSSSSASSSRSSSPVHAPTSNAAAAAAAPGQSNMEPADPWNSLQSQYAHGSPSPDSRIAGGSPPAAAVAPTSKAAAGAPGAYSLPPLHGAAAAGAAAGSRRTTGSKQPVARQELVLVDSDDEATELKQQQQQHKPGSGFAAAGTNRSSFSSASGGGKISAQASQHSLGSGAPHVTKSGSWGVGSLAGAGTIMLGDESSGVRRSPGIPQITAAAAAPAPAGTWTGAAAAHDDVFGDDEYEAPVLPKGLPAHAASLAAEGSSSSSSLRASHSRARVGAAVPAAAAAAEAEMLAVEEIEDEFDEPMMQSCDGLPADLAAKLAQFEATGVADGSHSEEEGDGSESPTIFAMMNNRQGSWRAA